jgi:hypothetical protein
MSEIFAQLAAPFAPHELDWRVARSGNTNGKPWAQVLVYIDARAARARLNGVLGPENWKVEYSHGPANGVIATLSLRIAGEWIAKQDGADVTDIEPVKGGLSGAFKRACAVWGIGEYLYDIGDSWAAFSENGAQRVKIDGVTHRWDPPKLSPQFLPKTPNAREFEQALAAHDSVNGAPAAPARPASRPVRTPNVETARATLMPFGRTKGRALGEIPLDDLRKARAWAEDNGKSYPEFMAASAVLLAADGEAAA